MAKRYYNLFTEHINNLGDKQHFGTLILNCPKDDDDSLVETMCENMNGEFDCNFSFKEVKGENCG